MLDFSLFGICIGCLSWLVCTRLIDTDEVMFWLPGVVRFLLTGSTKIGTLNKWQEYGYKALIGCPTCQSGWIVIILLLIGVPFCSVYSIPFAMATAEILTRKFP